MAKKREDQAFLDWLSFQPSWLDGVFSERDDKGRKRNIPCHVRRAGQAGTGYKPLHCAVPMTFKQHQIQTDQGELACIMAYTNYHAFLETYPGETLVEKAKNAFDNAAAYYRLKWEQSLCR